LRDTGPKKLGRWAASLLLPNSIDSAIDCVVFHHPESDLIFCSVRRNSAYDRALGITAAMLEFHSQGNPLGRYIMVQENLFPHEVKNGKQSQRAANTAQGSQPSVRTAPQAGFNRQAGEQRNRCGYGQPAAQQNAPTSNRVTNIAPRGDAALKDNGRVRLFGWIGRYFEVKQTQSGVSLATFSLATHKRYKDQAGNPLKETVWQRIVVWGEAAEAVGQQLRKGARVQVEGKFKTREWTDRENNLRTTKELVARDVRFLDAEDGAIAA
jgi:single-strand DNA-binding protein